MKAIAVIPVFDEAATVAAVVTATVAHASVLVVDDGSSDGSATAASAAGAEVLRHPRRLGKAQALRTGIAAARARGATVVVTLDGDGQHDAACLPALLAASAPRTIVIGSRLLGGEALPPDRLDAIRVAGFFVNWVTGLRVFDTQSGFRVYPIALFDEVRPRHSGFLFETEVLLAAAALGYRVREIEVPVLPRAAERSRFRPVSDGTRIGAFLVSQSLTRWAREARAAGAAVAAGFRAPRRQARHAAMLQAAACSDSQLWGVALGAEVARRLGDQLASWWNHPRRRRAMVAGVGSAAVPGVLALMVVQALAHGRWPHVLTPLVRALYAQERLDALPAGAGPEHGPPAEIEAAALAAPESR